MVGKVRERLGLRVPVNAYGETLTAKPLRRNSGWRWKLHPYFSEVDAGWIAALAERGRKHADVPWDNGDAFTNLNGLRGSLVMENCNLFKFIQTKETSIIKQ
jgi:hypothetical protein